MRVAITHTCGAPTYRNHQILCEFIIDILADDCRQVPGPNFIPNVKSIGREKWLKQLNVSASSLRVTSGKRDELCWSTSQR